MAGKLAVVTVNLWGATYLSFTVAHTAQGYIVLFFNIAEIINDQKNMGDIELS